MEQIDEHEVVKAVSAKGFDFGAEFVGEHGVSFQVKVKYLVHLQVNCACLLRNGGAKFSLATLGVSLDDDSEFVVDVGGVSLAVFDVLGWLEQKLASFVFVCQIVKAFSVKHCELLGFLEIGGAERRVESELAWLVIETLLIKLDFL